MLVVVPLLVLSVLMDEIISDRFHIYSKLLQLEHIHQNIVQSLQIGYLFVRQKYLYLQYEKDKCKITHKSVHESFPFGSILQFKG